MFLRREFSVSCMSLWEQASFIQPWSVQQDPVCFSWWKSVPPANGVAHGFACESDRSGVWWIKKKAWERNSNPDYFYTSTPLGLSEVDVTDMLSVSERYKNLWTLINNSASPFFSPVYTGIKRCLRRANHKGDNSIGVNVPKTHQGCIESRSLRPQIVSWATLKDNLLHWRPLCKWRYVLICPPAPSY